MNNFLPYYKFAKNQAWKISNSREVAEDIVQDIFLKLHKNNRELEDKHYKAYLTTAVRNQYLNRYRVSKNWKFEEIEDYANVFNISPSSSFLSDDIKVSMELMEAKLRLPLMLNVLYDYTYEEISKILDIPSGTVKNRIHRAKVFLREKLTEKI